jgi:hypothetical protein
MSPTEWGLYPWFEESGTTLVHPDDLDAFRKLVPYGKVFAVARDEGDFIRLAYGAQVFRVKPDLLRHVDAPKFAIGDRARIANKPGDVEIDAIQWHHKDERPFFLVKRNGKVESRRYWADDLEPG